MVCIYPYVLQGSSQMKCGGSARLVCEQQRGLSILSILFVSGSLLSRGLRSNWQDWSVSNEACPSCLSVVATIMLAKVKLARGPVGESF